MLNKKGGIASEEIIPIVVCLVIAMVAIIVFAACSTLNTVREYKEFKFSKDEIEASKFLNFFLEQPFDEERKVSDVIVESFLKDDHSEIEEIGIEEYFSKRCVAWDFSYSGQTKEYKGGKKTIKYEETYVVLPVAIEQGNIEFISILLYCWSY